MTIPTHLLVEIIISGIGGVMIWFLRRIAKSHDEQNKRIMELQDSFNLYARTIAKFQGETAARLDSHNQRIIQLEMSRHVGTQ